MSVVRETFSSLIHVRASLGTHAFVELSLIIMKFCDGHFVRLFIVQSGADGASV